ncbi:MAG: type II toxin-antitoxin system HicB family antitoxin [Proteobacteria bacterium]|nr:type II toxin-antitoxin system HicB family antitoxin [Pseudomonadota bacterium]
MDEVEFTSPLIFFPYLCPSVIICGLIICGSTNTSSHMYRSFVFMIEYQPEEPAYTVRFSDLPDIITSGETLAEAFANACEALDLHLESLQKLGLPIPQPRHRVIVEAA